MVVFTVIECGREILVALEGEGIGIILLLVLLLRVGILLLGGHRLLLLEGVGKGWGRRQMA